jgi:phosphoglycerate dehydrogenase-like enzyme
MTRVVLVGNPQVAAGLADLPGHRVVAMDGEKVPEPGRSASVLVPPFLAGPAATRVLGELPDLELIQLMSAGAEHWVSLVPDGVTLCTASGAHGGATAEWAVGALLAVLREFPQFAARQAEQRWDQHATDELGGKRVLVLGAGDLGRQVRARLEPFGVQVTMAARQARDGVLAIADVPAVLGGHDAVIVMVPLTPATTGLVDATFLAAMPDGAVLVNAARGAVVDTAALTSELSAGRLRAALDVTDPEPLPAGHPLWSAPGVFITPHVAGSVPGSTRRALAVVRAQLERFAAGEPLANVVTSAGY